MQQGKIRTLHIYFEEEEPPIIDAVSEQHQHAAPSLSRLPLLYLVLVVLWGVGIPVVAILLGQVYPNTYDVTISKTLTLTLSQHPSKKQLPLYTLSTIRQTQDLTVSATGSQHQDATKATGIITFYNGAFAVQAVPALTTFRGKSGIEVVITKTAIIPAATPTTPPTPGTVSVNAISSVSGSAGNIPASDIDQACCNTAILAQNLYAFSGGQDAQDITVLTESDLSDGKRALTARIDDAVNIQAQREAKPGDILLPLDCTNTFSASHQAGDQVASSLLTLRKTCVPLAYSATDIEKVAQNSIAIPRGYHLVSFAAFVAQSNVTAQGGTLRVKAIAYLKRIPRGQARTTSL